MIRLDSDEILRSYGEMHHIYGLSNIVSLAMWQEFTEEDLNGVPAETRKNLRLPTQCPRKCTDMLVDEATYARLCSYGRARGVRSLSGAIDLLAIGVQEKVGITLPEGFYERVIKEEEKRKEERKKRKEQKTQAEAKALR